MRKQLFSLEKCGKKYHPCGSTNQVSKALLSDGPLNESYHSLFFLILVLSDKPILYLEGLAALHKLHREVGHPFSHRQGGFYTPWTCIQKTGSSHFDDTHLKTHTHTNHFALRFSQQIFIEP